MQETERAGDSWTGQENTHNGREGLAECAEHERGPRAELRAGRCTRLLARDQQQAFDTLVRPVRYRGVHSEHQTGLDPEPEACDTLLANDFACDAEERVVCVGFLYCVGGRDGAFLQINLFSVSGTRFALILPRLRARAANLLPRRDNRHRDREYLCECTGECAEQKLGGGRERGCRGASRVARGEPADIRAADE